MLTEAQLLARCPVTASFVPHLMAGEISVILSHWQEAVGDPNWQPADYSNDWSVQLGMHLEPFVLDWHQRKTGQQLTRRGDVVKHPERNWFSATLDAYRASDDTVIDAKVIGGWRKIDEVVSYYTPQIICQCRCVGAKRGSLLIVRGGAEPEEHVVTWPPDYELAMWVRVEEYWRHVYDFTPPVPLPEMLPEIPAVKTYDMSGSNRWAAEAATWLSTREAAADNAAAAKELKALVPVDAQRVTGHGVIITRNRGGALSLRAQEESK